MRPTADQILAWLDLRPLPIEGGFFRQTYAGPPTPGAGSTIRPISTAIYFLLTDEAGGFSAIHRLPGDEIYHYYLGDPVEMVLLHPDGSSEVVVLGHDLAAGQKLQVVVSGGTWQGSRLADGGALALLGTTMAPGFIQRDYEAGVAEELTKIYPDRAEMIRRLTR